MYFLIQQGYVENHKWVETINHDEIKTFVESFSDIEIIKNELTDNFLCYYISKTAIRKLKIKSLSNEEEKERVLKLENILKDKFIWNFGERKPASSGYSGTSGTSGSSGTVGLSPEKYIFILKEMIDGWRKDKPIRNRFLFGKKQKNYDFHRLKKKLIKT